VKKNKKTDKTKALHWRVVRSSLISAIKKSKPPLRQDHGLQRRFCSPACHAQANRIFTADADVMTRICSVSKKITLMFGSARNPRKDCEDAVKIDSEEKSDRASA